MPSNGRITKVSSSNGKVAKISIGDNNVRIKPLKVGKSTIKVTVKTGRLLTTFTSQLTVYKWSNPVANYKIGNKQIKNQFKNTNIYNYKLGSKKTLKFDVKAKTGWKMTSFTYYDKLGKVHLIYLLQRKSNWKRVVPCRLILQIRKQVWLRML